MISLKMLKGAEMAEGVLVEQRLPKPMQRFVIGRDPGAHWPIPDRTLALSARHCEIVATPAGVVLRDLSTNGTFVNGAVARLAGDHPLHDGDRFELGPYTIVVQSGLPRAAAVPLKVEAETPPRAMPPPAAPRPASVEATAPLRGGDPAAMLASVAPARAGLTEILRAAPPAEDASVEVTKIRLAPQGAGAPAARPAGSTPMPAVGPGPAAPAVGALASPKPHAAPAPGADVPATPPPFALPSAVPIATPVAAPVDSAVATPIATAQMPAEASMDPMLVHLAAGLGLPANALAGRDPAQAAAQVGALARVAVTVLRQLLEQQSRERRQIGSRAPTLQAVRDVNPLRLAATPEAALLALLVSGADSRTPLQRAADELSAHPQRLLAAFSGAMQRLGEEIAPLALQAALPAPGGAQTLLQQQARQAQLWTLYTQVWQGMGLAPGQPWPQGFVEAARLHLAAAYDAPGPTGQP